MTSYLEELTKRPLAKPCAESWENMSGDDKVRECARCEKRVYNLSAMTPREAEIRLLNAEGLPCIQYRQDDAGRPMMQSEPSARRSHAAVWVAGALAVAAVGSEARAEPTSPPASAPPRPTSAASAPSEQCVKSAPAPGASAPTPTTKGKPPPPPPMLGGAPAMVATPIARGTLEVKSSRPLRVTVSGVEFQAPAASIQLPPGKHELVAYDGKQIVKKLTVTLQPNAKVVVDLK